MSNTTKRLCLPLVRIGAFRALNLIFLQITQMRSYYNLQPSVDEWSDRRNECRLYITMLLTTKKLIKFYRHADRYLHVYIKLITNK